MTSTVRSRVRCAVYTRKSSEEGLEQSFNSLQAQREACEAYIASQRHEGWHVIPTKYDDGGFSGGNINRPALKQLLEDIAARVVDTVVVYKVDRLTRSLMDFSKIIETFDQKGISFVSVTQQFNTTTSMGRLTLNVLLSFAQFEREVTGERIRDKIAASKKKGMWMGGVVPLGYDLKGRKLVINPKEANIVQEIFEQYVSLGSVAELKQYLDRKRVRTKVRTSANGRVFGGERYSRGGLYKLLKNQIYIGKIVHIGETYAGQQPAIVSVETWDKVSALLEANNQGRRQRGKKLAPNVLAGLVFDGEGNRYTPTHAVKGGRRYRYYTSQAVIQKRKKPSHLDRIPAKELEQLVSSRIQKVLGSPDELSAACVEAGWPEKDLTQIMDAARALGTDWSKPASTEIAVLVPQIVRRVILRGPDIQIQADFEALCAYALRDSDDFTAVEGKTSKSSDHLFTLASPFTIDRRRGELRLVLAGASPSRGDANSSLLKGVVRAQRWKQRIVDGEIYCKEQLASEANLNASYVGRILGLAALGPESIDAVVHHRNTFEQPLSEVLNRIPLDWRKQEKLLLLL